MTTTNSPTTNTAYADGGAAPNPGPCGAGVYLERADGTTESVSRPLGNGTNNIGELAAVQIACEIAPKDEPLLIVMDSQYAINMTSKNWTAKVNQAEVAAAKAAVAARTAPTTFQWVKGHNGNAGNERADALATKARLNVSSVYPTPSTPERQFSVPAGDPLNVSSVYEDEKNPGGATNTPGVNQPLPTNRTVSTSTSMLDSTTQKQQKDYTTALTSGSYERQRKYLADRAVPPEYALSKNVRWAITEQKASYLRASTGGLPAGVADPAKVKEDFAVPVHCDGILFQYSRIEEFSYARLRNLDTHYTPMPDNQAELLEQCVEVLKEKELPRYYAPYGKECPPYLSCVSKATLADATKPLIIVEGPAKALALTYHTSTETIALGGVFAGWASKTDKLEFGAEVLQGDLAAAAWTGRQVTIVFDAGRLLNPTVAWAEARLASVLRDAGAIVKVASVPLHKGGDQGPDDYIARTSPAAILDVLTAAVPSGLDMGCRDIASLSKDLPFCAALYAATQAEREQFWMSHKKVIGGKKVIGEMVKAFEERLNAAQKKSFKEAPDPQGRPVVKVTTDMHVVEDDAISALKGHPDLYARAGVLLRHYPSPDPDAASTETMVALQRSTCRTALSERARFVAEGKEGEYPVMTPEWLAAQIVDKGVYHEFRTIKAVVRHPVIRPDGTVAWNGFDAKTGYLINSSVKPIDVSAVTYVEARYALDEIIEIVSEFPYVSAAHRAAYLCHFLTLACRPAVKGAVPLVVYDANSKGSGKSWQTDTIAMVWQNRFEAENTNNVGDDAEARKALTTVMMSAPEMILWDNVTGLFGNPILDGLITKCYLKDRLLGANKEVVLEQIQTIYSANGNNFNLRNDDTIRRTLYCRLESDPNQVEKKFSKDLRDWVPANRDRLIYAGLKVIIAYIQAGKPRQNIPAWGGFESWSDLVRSAVVWLGEPDPKANLSATADISGQSEKRLGVIDALLPVLRKEAGCKASIDDMITWAVSVRDTRSSIAVDDDKEVLTSALEMLCNTPRGRALSKTYIGSRFRSINGDWSGGQWALVKVGDRANSWTLRHVSKRYLSEMTAAEIDATLGGAPASASKASAVTPEAAVLSLELQS